MEAIRQWAASICFSAAAAGLCYLLAPDSSLGRMFKMSISVFFLCSILLPLGKVDLSFSSEKLQKAERRAEQISQQTALESQSAAYELMKDQIQKEVGKFLAEEGITPVQTSIDIIQQDSSPKMELMLLLQKKDQEKQEWLFQNLESEYITLRIDYTEGEIFHGIEQGGQ